ncbi:MAG: peptidoglycan editing factor PgeF [Rhodocyclaceae bacterium]|nr:peptidoglycan editing factor PgeF [Rhodocyclaceae bacterium]
MDDSLPPGHHSTETPARKAADRANEAHADLFLSPDWPAPPNVHALVTTRAGGASTGPWQGLNLATHVGDDPAHVALNRAWLRAQLPAEPAWLEQVHGTDCVVAESAGATGIADASVSFEALQVCAVLTADCLPVLFCSDDGKVVAAAHAGWRGLLAGVLENTLAAMHVAPLEIMAWLGPAIGPQRFEVGAEVRDLFVAQDAGAADAFVAHGDKWLADIYALARMRLRKAGLTAIYGGGLCTVSDAERFYSYRRDGATGRMASLIWRA